MLLRMLVVVTLSLAAMDASAATKIGYVQLQKMLQSPQSLEAGKKLQKEFAPRNAELTRLKKQIDDKEAGLEKELLTLPEDKRRVKSQEFSNLKIDFQRKQRELAEDFDLRKNEEQNKLQDRINKAVVDIATAEAYDLVLYGNAAYAGTRVDITDKVLKAIK